jgi:hypothetical protein
MRGRRPKRKGRQATPLDLATMLARDRSRKEPASILQLFQTSLLKNVTVE